MTYHSRYSPKFTNLPENGKLLIPENTTKVIDIHAVDNYASEGNGLKYSIVGGADREFFEIDSQTGVLSFKDAPDFENPQDSFPKDHPNNIYDVKVRVQDKAGYYSEKPLWVMVTDQDETPKDPILKPGTYQLCNHPDGNAASPLYGLRLDGLLSGDTHDIYTFDFEDPRSDMRMTVNEDGSIRIFGTVYGGLDEGTQYNPNESGLWKIDFKYNNVNGLAGDDDLIVEGAAPKSEGSNTGSITQLFGAGQTFDLNDFANMNGDTFFLGNGADDNGHRGFDSISGWGWLNHSGADEHLSASDWLFTVKPEPLTTSLGDKVFIDDNGNGIQDNNEVGLQGVDVTLSGAGEDGQFGTADDISRTLVTDGNGEYRFDNLDAGDYKVTFSNLLDGLEFTTQDAGNNDALDSDANALGVTEVISLEAGDNIDTVDAGVVIAAPPQLPKAGFGDRIFLDANGNGVQDDGEKGVAGVRVSFSAADNNIRLVHNGDGTFSATTGGTFAGETVTDENGFYKFENLPSGENVVYNVSVDLPDGFAFTQADLGGNDAKDSDVDANGQTGPFTLTPDTFDDTIDAGIVGATLGDRVFEDKNGNGFQDPGEGGVGGVTVTLNGAGDDGQFGTADDPLVRSTTTSPDGTYKFEGLKAGDYKVTFSDLPNGFQFTNQNVGGNEALDSDADPSSGMTQPVTLNAGETNNDLDAGLVKLARLGDYVFNDVNQNGIFDQGELGVGKVRVTLDGAGDDGQFGTNDDTRVSQLTTNNGRYRFIDLTPGQEYKLTFELPDGYEFTTQDAGTNDRRDSDVNPNNGMIENIVLESGEVNFTLDAGLVLVNNPDGKTKLIGTGGKDTLSGSMGDDHIKGLGEMDFIKGFDGDDCLFGGGGYDTLLGGNGADTLDGGGQDDILFGQAGKDVLIGAKGNDTLVGGGSNDVLNGTRESLQGAGEIDELDGGAGVDIYILGDTNNQYYVAQGTDDYALIHFDATKDKLQLNRTSGGVVSSYTTNQNGSNLELLSNGELVAVLTNTNSLDLADPSTVQYV